MSTVTPYRASLVSNTFVTKPVKLTIPSKKSVHCRKVRSQKKTLIVQTLCWSYCGYHGDGVMLTTYCRPGFTRNELQVCFECANFRMNYILRYKSPSQVTHNTITEYTNCPQKLLLYNQTSGMDCVSFSVS